MKGQAFLVLAAIFLLVFGAVVSGSIFPARVLIADRRLRALAGLQIALAVIAGLVGFFLLSFLRQRGIALILTGSVISVFNLVTGLIQMPCGRMTDRSDKYRITLVSGLATTSAFLFSLCPKYLGHGCGHARHGGRFGNPPRRRFGSGG